MDSAHDENYHLSEDLAEQAIAWMKRHQAFAPDRPFFMYWAPGAAHGPGAQYLMRPIRTWEEFEKNVEFFVTTADAYHCHFLLFPEFFTAQLFTLMPAEWNTRRAI